MLDVEIFKDRVTALWESQKRMAAPRKWKSGKRAGVVRKPASVILFTKQDLERWLWRTVGLNAIRCPYCNAPIDILALTLDHIEPRSIGGQFALDNMQPICHDCQERKGNLTHEAYANLMRFASSELSAYDQGILLARLKAAHHGAGQRFHRDNKPKQQPPAPPAATPGLDFSGLGDF